jgi:RNA-splicing ligase RtcB
MKIADKLRQTLSPETNKSNAWIPLDSREGEDYWEALQIVREWTRQNHSAIHDLTLDAVDGKATCRRWNEHNFVFRDDMTIYHAKGATPIHDPFIPDTDGVQIIPLNMAEPILLVPGERNKQNLGFAPHGAGRNKSRTAHLKSLAGRKPEDVLAEETRGIDARFWCGHHDLSELPSAYKNAKTVQDDMKAFGLADVVDRVMPYGSIMAGNWQQDAPWRKKKRRRVSS